MQKELQNPFACNADQHFDTNMKWAGLIFHTDDVNQCLLKKSGGHGVPKTKKRFVQLYVSPGQFY